MTANFADPRLLDKHRIEALTDAIYAVAMTLLVIDLKLPDGIRLEDHAAMAAQLHELVPRLIAWIVSFFVLAVFWVAHLKLFRHLRAVDPRLMWLNLATMLLASLLPFGSDLVGEHEEFFASHAIYGAILAALSLAWIYQVNYLASHPELCHPPVPASTVAAARFRGWSLVAVAGLAVVVAAFEARYALLAFILMIPLGRAGSKIEGP